MNTFRLNGETATADAGASVAVVVTTLTGRELTPAGHAADGGRLGVAVALNGGIVPRSAWHTTPVATGDDLEIVTAVQGG